MTRWGLPALVAATAVAAFLAGRATAGRDPAPARPGSYDAGYRAGREEAFAGFDGGWALGAPYIVTLRRGEPGITYRVARREPLLAGRAYRVCARAVCSTPISP
jgi:hypothetical protein